MVRLILRNNVTSIEGAESRITKVLDLCLSYTVEGHYYSESFKEKLWDGKEHLFKFNQKYGYFFPTGMWYDVIRILRDTGTPFKVKDKRREPAVIPSIQWRDDTTELRPYQDEAVVAATLPGRGRGRLILKMPIRSGKTFTAAKIIDEYKHKALFIVNSEMLLAQTITTFENIFQAPIGKVGDGDWNVEDITVATIQTLMERGPILPRPGQKARKATPEYQSLMDKIGLEFFDECHHLEAKRWRDLILHSGAKYRIGLSATAFLAETGENEKGTIWLKACCGPIAYEISISKLIEDGYLAPLEVRLIKFKTLPITGPWPEPYVAGIVENVVRNSIAADQAAGLANDGGLVLIHATRLDHIAILSEMLDKKGADHRVMVGETKRKDRRHNVEDFKTGAVRILLGNLFGEGVDIPACDCVINAAGGKSEISTIQRIRNLTSHVGKKRAVLIDFADLHNEYLAGHSLSRIKTYKTEPLFDLKVIG